LGHRGGEARLPARPALGDGFASGCIFIMPEG
jgi:hypothetical protein